MDECHGWWLLIHMVVLGDYTRVVTSHIMPTTLTSGQVSDESDLSVYNSGSKVGVRRVAIRFCSYVERVVGQAISKHS